MKIKCGYNDKETIIKIYPKRTERKAELWIQQNGIDDTETLSYMTLDELLDLKDEINQALEDIIN